MALDYLVVEIMTISLIWTMALVGLLGRAQQLLTVSPPGIPLEFPAAPVMIPVSGKSAALDSTDETCNYALMGWIIQFQVASPGVVFFGLYTNDAVNFSVVKKLGGEYEVKTYDITGASYALTVSGSFNRWEHLAVGVCANAQPYTLTVCTTVWKDAGTVCQSRMVDTQPVTYSPDFTRITIGDSSFCLMYGQYANLQFYSGACLSPSPVHNWISAYPCSPECNSSCSGPGFYFCTSFSQLVRSDYSRVANNGVWAWYSTDPNFMNRGFTGTDVGLTGWFRCDDDPAVTTANLFKLENDRCYWPAPGTTGCQVLGVYVDSAGVNVNVEDAAGAVNIGSIPEVSGNVDGVSREVAVRRCRTVFHFPGRVPVHCALGGDATTVCRCGDDWGRTGFHWVEGVCGRPGCGGDSWGCEECEDV